MSIHASAVVDPQARIHPSVDIAPYVIVQGPVSIGENCRISSFAVLKGSVDLGANCTVHSHAIIGDVPQDRRYENEDSRCVIGAGSIIREGATVHRATGAGQQTVIGERCFLMTNSHVGHNCVVGNDVTIISGTLLGGHVRVDERAVISGNCAIHQFVRIGRLAMIGGVAPVVQDVPPFALTDHHGRVVGLNLVGLKRAGYTSDQRNDIKHAFRLLYRSGIASRDIVDVLKREQRTDAVATLVEFLQEPSSRGLMGVSRRLRLDA